MAIIIGTMGDDLLDGTPCTDLMIGDKVFYTVVANPNDFLILPTPEVVFGNDVINGKNGNDLIYGDTVLTSLTANSGLLIYDVTDFAVVFGSDTINGNDGNDWLVGDSKDFILSAKAGKATTADMNAAVVNIPVIAILNVLDGGSGNDTLIGGFENLKLSATGGISTSAFSAAALVANQTPYNFYNAANTLSGGDGNDKLIGSSMNLDIAASGGDARAGRDASALINSIQFRSGSNPLDGGNGNDVLIGAYETLSITLTAGKASNDGDARAAFGYSNRNFIRTDTFTDFTNTFTGGSGNDTIIGSVGTLSITLKGGEAATGGKADAFFGVDLEALPPTFPRNDGLLPNAIRLNKNTLDGGSGNDLLIGSAQNLKISLNGGKASADSTAAALFVGNEIDSGSHILNGGAGNDKLIGDVQNISITLKGGTSTSTGAAWANFNGNTLIFGGNVLNGGDGNDVLIGSIENLNISLTNGSGGALAKADMVDNIVQFFGNTLIGGAGNDTLYATMVNISQLAPLTNVSDPSAFGYGVHSPGENVLRGGTGNDTLYGGVGVTYADFSDATSGVKVNLGLTGSQNVGGGLGNDKLINVNGVIGTGYADTLTGNSENNFIRGGDGKDTVDGKGGWDVLSFRDVTQATDNSAHGPVAVPNDYFNIYTALKNVYGDSFLLTPPNNDDHSITIDGVWIDPSDFGAGVHSVTHGTTTTTFQSIEGFEGTWGFSNYIAANEYYLLHPDATAAEAGANAPTLIAGANSTVVDGVVIPTSAENVLIGGSGNDLIFGGRSAFNYISAGAGDDIIHAGLGLNEGLDLGLDHATAQYPFGKVVEATPNRAEPIYTLTYAGEGNDTVYAFCSGLGLQVTYLGGGDDTFNDFCPHCSIVTYGGDGNDKFLIDCSTSLKHTFGDAGNDVIFLIHNLANDISDGGAGNDLILNWFGEANMIAIAGESDAGVFTGGTGDDIFGVSMKHDDNGYLAVNGGDVLGSLTITDFKQVAGNNDKLHIAVGAADDFATLNGSVASNSLVTVDGVGVNNDTLITFQDGSSLTLLNADLTAGFSAANTVLVY